MIPHPYTPQKLRSLLEDALREEDNDYGDKQRAIEELAEIGARVLTALGIGESIG